MFIVATYKKKETRNNYVYGATIFAFVYLGLWGKISQNFANCQQLRMWKLFHAVWLYNI